MHFAFCNNYIEYESTVDKNKTPSIKEYLKETKLHLSNMMN